MDDTQEKFWNQNAENWAKVIAENLISSRSVTNPAIVAEILKLAPNSVLDIGCGEGWLAKPSTDAGIQYLGIDGSAKLTEIASSRNQSRNQAPFLHVTYQQIVDGWQPKQRPDLAVFNFSLLDEDIAELLRKVSDFLAPGGSVVIQTLHSANLPFYQDGWHKEDFKSMTIPFAGSMPWYGRTKESWLSLFAKAGLKLERTIEPVLTGRPVSIIFVLRR